MPANIEEMTAQDIADTLTVLSLERDRYRLLLRDLALSVNAAGDNPRACLYAGPLARALDALDLRAKR